MSGTQVSQAATCEERNAAHGLHHGILDEVRRNPGAPSFFGTDAQKNIQRSRGEQFLSGESAIVYGI